MKKLFMCLVLTTSLNTFASGGAESKTLDMYAPKAGNSEFVAGVLFPTGKVEAGAVSSTVTGMALMLGYGYAFSDMATVYVNQGYSNYEWTTNPGGSKDKTIGIGDTKIGVKAILDYSQYFFYYDVGYNMGLLSKAKSDTTSNESTPISYRPSLQLTGGVGGNFDMFGVGALLRYSLYQEGNRDSESAGVTTTTTHKAGGGMDWKIYAQYQANFKLGFSYGETTVDSYDKTTSGVTTSNAKSELKSIALYTIIPFAASSEVDLQLMKPEPKDTAGSTYSLLYFTVAYRMTF